MRVGKIKWKCGCVLWNWKERNKPWLSHYHQQGDAALEISMEDLNKDDGMKTILEKLEVHKSNQKHCQAQILIDMALQTCNLSKHASLS